MGHNYIVSSTPYLVTTKPPIYKVPTGLRIINPYGNQPGTVKTIANIEVDIQKGEDMDTIEITITDAPENAGTEESSVELITPVEQEVRKPVSTYKFKVGDKSQTIELFDIR